mmetsp:Transcript_5450/g.18294  ORF Transcript_5450/g.18294 Transcript_5450/m.18294 type:complete len:239 (+) Transcript_5450:1279-1995(+)
MTPEVIISWYRSLPSRVRSPTPAKTEKPPWAFAMLLISSIITTVLPTPAPPKSPILPPLGYGSIRSITLMPVESTSCSTDCSVKTGASLWIGDIIVESTGPSSSIGSPMTFMMRPSTPLPTGMQMGASVSTTVCPRTRPSVASIAMVRTVLSPRCCATSRTSRISWPSTSRLLRIAGSGPSNCTSTTAPMTVVTLPVDFSRAATAANGAFESTPALRRATREEAERSMTTVPLDRRRG